MPGIGGLYNSAIPADHDLTAISELIQDDTRRTDFETAIRDNMDGGYQPQPTSLYAMGPVSIDKFADDTGSGAYDNISVGGPSFDAAKSSG